MIRRPPRSTPFPTRRSSDLRDALALAARELDAPLADQGLVAPRQPRDELVRVGRPGRLDDLLVGDRKSTRLNSSHANISYAVFCLKKKTRSYTHRERYDVLH